MLTDPEVRGLKPREDGKPSKVFDGEGLYVFVTPSGGKLWRFNYKVGGVHRTLSIGAYPAVTLKAARLARSEAQAMINKGVDPCAAKQERKREMIGPLLAPRAVAKTFREFGREWCATMAGQWVPGYARTVLGRLEADVYPYVGARPIAELTRADILEVLKRIEARGALESTRRVRQYISSVFDFAADELRDLVNVTPRKGIKAPPRPKHHPTLHGKGLGKFLLALEANTELEAITRLALRFTLLTVARTKETRFADWEEFNNTAAPSKAQWRIEGEKMKRHRAHLVPLSLQACEVLEEVKKISPATGFVFPGDGKGGVLSENTMLFGCYRLGFHSKQTPHGFRSAFSTWANEAGFNSDHIEACLSHSKDDVRAAYNHAQYLPQRRELLQAWADHLDKLTKHARLDARLAP